MVTAKCSAKTSNVAAIVTEILAVWARQSCSKTSEKTHGNARGKTRGKNCRNICNKHVANLAAKFPTKVAAIVVAKFAAMSWKRSRQSRGKPECQLPQLLVNFCRRLFAANLTATSWIPCNDNHKIKIYGKSNGVFCENVKGMDFSAQGVLCRNHNLIV
jgi:hypothetical protein